MKKLLRTAALAAALMGASAGFAWVGNSSFVEAFAVSEDGDYYPGCCNYPQFLRDGVELAYTHHGNGWYVDKNSVTVDKVEGDILWLSGNVYMWNKDKDYHYGPEKHTYGTAYRNGQFYIFYPNGGSDVNGSLQSQSEAGKASFSVAAMFVKAVAERHNL